MNKTIIVFKANRVFVTSFYSFLVCWTLISVPALINKSAEMSHATLGMIVFVIAMTWYWSLGLVHRIELENNRIVRMKSLRRNIIFKLDEFRRIDAPPIRMGFGFIKFRSAKESYYVFFSNSEPLQNILKAIKKNSPDTRFTKFSHRYLKETITL
jgi:hypothetical protein